MTDFSPVCFLPWRAAWPDVVKVSEQAKREACGQGNFFLGRFGSVGEALLVVVFEVWVPAEWEVGRSLFDCEGEMTEAAVGLECCARWDGGEGTVMAGSGFG